MLDKVLDKTFVGKRDKGIDFLGCHFGNCTREGVSIARKSGLTIKTNSPGFMGIALVNGVEGVRTAMVDLVDECGCSR